MDAASMMTPEVVTVGPEVSVEEIAKAMIQRRISAVPVVDSDNRVLGIVSEGDLMRRPESETERHPSWWLQLAHSPTENAVDYLKSHGRTAEQVMTKNVISVAPDTSATEIAETLEKMHIKRVPVISNGKLVGIVSRANLLHALASHLGDVSAGPAPNDKALREEVVQSLMREGLPSEDYINPIVRDGIVHLWGAVETPELRDAINLAAESVDGVKGVESHIGILDNLSRSLMWAE